MYANKLLSLNTFELNEPVSNLSYIDLFKLANQKQNPGFKIEILKIADKLPFKTENWPVFGQYQDDCYCVEVSQLQSDIFYCERGNKHLHKRCSNLIDLVFEIMRLVVPFYTSSASRYVETLDRIADQRLLIWLRKSSETYYMYQISNYFGNRSVIDTLSWMCDELVRMGIATNTVQALKCKKYILKGLQLSGLTYKKASEIYLEMDGRII